jgi:hypothetical protein
MLAQDLALQNTGFANLKTLDELNWQFNPAIDRRRFDELPTCRLVRKHRDLLIIEHMGMKRLPRNSGEYLFEVIMRRYETRSTVMTSNRPIEDWGKLIGDAPAAGAIPDRFLHHAEVIPIEGRNCGLGNGTAKEDLTHPRKEVESPRVSGGFWGDR